ncbi:MAG TPA: 8-amino-7-oxononanoate synthase [Pirellulales bacterium]|jgi:8-amino-7-oxononanoate synthase|nr:8-amino-7-oxononanoate synthase [Pirellulales bacterium]
MSAEANPLAWLTAELERLDQGHLRRSLSTHGGPPGPTLLRGGRSVLNFGSNDYLGLANDPRVTAAARHAIEQFGWGAGASPLVVGRSELHAQLEQELARFESTEAALVFPSGFAANIATVAALVERGDVVFSDEKNHASLIDGCRLSRAEVRIYRHGDAADLQQQLLQAGGFRRRLIATDTLFSMDGDFAPLAELARLAERCDAMLLCDEAHATGLFGAKGRGVAELAGLETASLIRVGTMSKALGGVGGFVAGSRALIDWLTNRARAYVFSTASPAPSAAASLAALEIVRTEPARRTALLARAADLRRRLRSNGWQLGGSASQIIPLIMGSAERTLRLTEALLAEDIFVPGIRPPSVPEGAALLRISLCAGHTPAMVEQLVAALERCRAQIDTG